MWKSWSRASNAYSSTIQKLQDVQCTKNYYNSKTDIENNIAKLDKTSHRHFCNNCSKIKETIINKDKEFKTCYADKSKQLQLIDANGDIQRFIDECSSVYSQCIQKRSARDKKPVELKSKSEKNCETNGSCKQKISTVPHKNKSPPRLAPESPSTGSSQKQISQNPSGKLANAEKSRQQVVILEDQKDVNGSVISVEAKGKASEPLSIHHSSITVPVVTSMQHSSLASSEAQVLDMHKGADPQHNRSTHHSHSDNTGQTSDSSGKSHQHILSGHQDSDGKTQIENIRARNIPGSLDHGDQSLALKTADALPIVHINTVSGEQGNQNHISSSTNIDYKKKITADHVHTLPVGSTNLLLDHLTIGDVPSAGRSAEEKLSHTEGSHHTSTDSEVSVGVENNVSATRSEDDDNESDDAQDVDQVTHCIKNAGGALSDSGTTCTEARSSEFNDVNGNILDTLKKLFDSIPNKDHIIQASAPMGIVLLLGLLFKYTPLWRVLTKKNRKKGAGIIEELNSVVQEPSIMDEERSIPFSYGAFEYSSFDQNSY